MRRFNIEGTFIDCAAPNLAALMAHAHASQARPLCLCQSPGIAMYVAHVAGRHSLKRMPGTGPLHSASCDSYEPPFELSGFGQVAGGAIRENAEDGTTLLKLDFSLTKTGGKTAAVAGEASESASVRTDGAKLSLRALLHYLWDQAEFNRWRPGMAGKRNWAVIRKFLTEAAEGKFTKGKPLADILYIPEMFQSEREAEIMQRRTNFLNQASRSDGNKRQLLLLIGEVKEIAPARFGHKLVVRHMPKYPFLLNEDLHRRMATKFAGELAIWNADDKSRLIAIATFGLDAGGVASVETISLMLVNENWIPFESVYEAALLEALTRRRANFLKSLRYNLGMGQPLASVVLREDGAAPLAMYIVPPKAEPASRIALEQMIETSDLAAWVWNAGENPMPPLPL